MEQPTRYTAQAIATMDSSFGPYGLLRDGEVVVADGRIVWCGPANDLPGPYASLDRHDFGDRLMTPVLIDCHTHLVYGGNRAREFEMRLSGASYEDIARAGGGIRSTVAATRSASDNDLLAAALTRVDALMADGVRVIEIKSGYGLSIDDELRMLRIARSIEQQRAVAIKTTWLAAHAVPPEFEGRESDYLESVVVAGLRAAHADGLVDAVDGFCESIAFSASQMRGVFETAHELGLPVKLHAEQLSDQKGALLVAEFGGLSADHLEHLSTADVPAFAESGAVAVLLPGAFYVLRETQQPPIDALRSHSVPMALATDCNPGSSPISSLRTVMNMGCTLFGMTSEEALLGVTRNAAQALGVEADYGSIAAGRKAAFAVWDVEHPAELSYSIGNNSLAEVIFPRAHA